jgi:hypothetical protein
MYRPLKILAALIFVAACSNSVETLTDTPSFSVVQSVISDNPAIVRFRITAANPGSTTIQYHPHCPIEIRIMTIDEPSRLVWTSLSRHVECSANSVVAVLLPGQSIDYLAEASVSEMINGNAEGRYKVDLAFSFDDSTVLLDGGEVNLR